MRGIVIASHGKMAEGLLDSLTLFLGEEPEQIEAVCLMAGEDLQTYTKRLKDAIDLVDTGDGAVVFCDLLFGTPCNCCAAILRDEQYSNKTQVITGMNLPMLLEFSNLRTIESSNEETKDHLMEVGKEGIKDFNAIVEEARKNV